MTQTVHDESRFEPTGTATRLDRYRMAPGTLSAFERSGANDRCLQYASPSGFPRTGVVARIFKPVRSAMTSGKAHTMRWILRFEPHTPPVLDPLMGWCGGSDALRPVELWFPSKETAIAYATRQGLAFTVNEATRPTRTYADNFRAVDPAHSVFEHPAAIEVDMRKALADPARVFASPGAVLEHPALSRRAKVEILRRWAWDARLVQIAEAEAMPETGEPSRLEEVLNALVELGETGAAMPPAPANDRTGMARSMVA
jgi:hypothetical protein